MFLHGIIISAPLFASSITVSFPTPSVPPRFEQNIGKKYLLLIVIQNTDYFGNNQFILFFN